jgi:2,4-dienoyl-CoA reductase (NADPH2)
VIGAGGIGVDVSVHLVERGHKSHKDVAAFRQTWGVEGEAAPPAPAHEVVLMQRSEGRMGAGPGKTTGWVHRLVLLRSKVEMIAGAAYRSIDDEGLHITVGGEDRVIPCDSVVLCAGQDSQDSLAGELEATGASVHVIGGAKLARELDAQRAIEEGVRLAAAL